MKSQTEAPGKDLPVWRTKSITFSVNPGTSTQALGISGNVVETLLFLYRGSWPAKIKPRMREEVGGTTWDDMWSQAAAAAEAAFEVPYSVKALVMEDAWRSCLKPASSNGGVPNREGKSSDEEEDEAQLQEETHKEKKGRAKKVSNKKEKGKQEGGKNNGDKNDTDKKGNGKKEAGKKDSKKASSKKAASKKDASKKESKKESSKKESKKSSKKECKKDSKEVAKKKAGAARSLLPKADYIENLSIPSDGGASPEEDLDALFSKDYHVMVWNQIYAEFQSRGVVLWTPGNATAVFAAIRKEIPVLAIAMNETHAAIIKHAVDCRIVAAVQAQSSGGAQTWMKAYAHDVQGIKRKLAALEEGEDYESEDGKSKANKKSDKKNKKKDKKDIRRVECQW